MPGYREENVLSMCGQCVFLHGSAAAVPDRSRAGERAVVQGNEKHLVVSCFGKSSISKKSTSEINYFEIF